jgi:formylglycine-generating enzyme required for sulfatase activity
MKRLLLFFTLILLGIIGFAQNTSPLVVKDFMLQTNGIMDIDQVPRDARTDWDNNPVCQIQVKAVGFDENLMQKFVFVADGLDIMYKTIRDGKVLLYVSSNKNGKISIKYLGDFDFTLPYKLEGSRIYEMALGMKEATLIITANPTESEIYIDNEKIGEGSVNKELSIGIEHHYKVLNKDYYSEEGTIVFLNVETKEIKVKLEPNFGLITVTSEPYGADVLIDGKNVGKTPYVNQKISRGPHRVELRKEGYNGLVKVIKIRAGETNVELDSVALVPKEMKYGALVINSTPQDADVVVDGREIGKTPIAVPNLLIGNHSVVLNKKGYFQITENVVILENDTTVLSLELLKGQEITIVSNKTGDKIFFDGKYLGASPVTTTLTIGSHDLVAARGGSSEVLTDLLKEKDVHYSQKLLNVSLSNNPITENISIPIYDRTFTVNGVTFDMVAVEGGSVPSFNIGRYEVTQSLWQAVMGSLPNMAYYDDNLPVSNVSWYDAVEFCNILSEKCGLQKYYNIDKTGGEWQVTINTDADGFCLPTVEEWKYAAKGGKKSKGYKYSGGDYITNVAWFDQNSGDRFLYEEEVDYGDSKNLNRYFKRLDKIHKLLENNKCRTRIVGQRDSNELGLYDMTGNVNEWCYDTNDKKPLCGGCYNSSKSYCEVDDCEKHYSPDSDYSSNGLRIILKY